MGGSLLSASCDDLYLLGFANRDSRWHILRYCKGLPGSVTLPIEENYGELIDGGHAMLYTVPLGNQSAVQAVRTLSRYNRATTTKAQLKDAMVRFVVMISEAMRFVAIRNVFAGHWEEETFINLEQAKYVIHWGALSRLLVFWDQSHWVRWSGKDAEDVKEIHVNNWNDAWLLVDFLLRPY
ncbi:hypothetical protein EJB05_28727, partial [Eragrostis curvula]